MEYTIILTILFLIKFNRFLKKEIELNQWVGVVFGFYKPNAIYYKNILLIAKTA